MILLNFLLEHGSADAWKYGGIGGFCILGVLKGIKEIWKYHVGQLEKIENFFISEKEKYEGQAERDKKRIQELESEKNALYELQIKELREAKDALRLRNIQIFDGEENA